MTTEGWIFMVGFRVFDVGLLILWLVWFFRLRDDDDSTETTVRAAAGRTTRGTTAPAAAERFPLGWARPGKRTRDHRRRTERPPRRGPEPMPRPSPARVRQPAGPAPGHRRPTPS